MIKTFLVFDHCYLMKWLPSLPQEVYLSDHVTSAKSNFTSCVLFVENTIPTRNVEPFIAGYI